MPSRVEDWGYFDLASEQEIFFLRGKDAPAFLNKYLTQDVLRMPTPGAALGVFLTQKGKIVSESWVLKFPDRVLLIFPKGYGERVKAHLAMFLDLEEMELAPAPEDFFHLALLGPAIPAEIISCLSGERKDQVGEFSYRGLAGWCWGSDRFGASGMELLLAKASSAPWQGVFSQAGGQPLSRETLERLRIGAGLPKMGIDMREDNLVAEVGLDKRATSFTKGCYLGQETTARVNTQGHVNRKLTRLRLEKPIEAPLPLEVFQGDKKVGEISSAVTAADGHETWALGMIQSKALASEALAKEALTLSDGRQIKVMAAEEPN